MAAAPRPRCLVTAGSPLLASRTDSVAAATGFDGIPPPIQPGGDPPPLPWLSWATASDELSPPMWPCMGTKRGLSAAQMDPVESTAMAAAAGVLLVPRADMQLIKPINRHAVDAGGKRLQGGGIQEVHRLRGTGERRGGDSGEAGAGAMGWVGRGAQGAVLLLRGSFGISTPPTIRRASFWQRACKVLAPADRWAFLRASALQTPSGWGLGRSRGRQRDCSAPWPRRAYHGGYGRHAHRLFEPPPQQLTRTAAERWWGLVFRGCLRG